MIENNPSNVSSGFEMLLVDVDAEIDFITRIVSHVFKTKNFRKVHEETKAERRNLSLLLKGLSTPEASYYLPILKAFIELGGSAKMQSVPDRVHKAMKPILKDVDHEPLASDPDMPRWRNSAQWARNTMRKEGQLKDDSPHGTWEITPAGKDRVQHGKLAMARRHGLRIKGDETVLNRPKVALFCSVKCPGKLILDTYDLAKQFRDEGVTVISGFHSPMEQECLRILLRSTHPVIWCLARGLYRHIPTNPVDCRAAVAEGRLVMITPFPDTVRYITTKTAKIRNRLVADMASSVVVTHAAPGSKMEALCRELLAEGKPVYTFDHPANAALIQAGAEKLDINDQCFPFTGILTVASRKSDTNKGSL